jgi:hypothetical protein
MRHGRPMTLVFARRLSEERSLAGQKTWFPRDERHYAPHVGSVPSISGAAFQSRRLDLPMRCGYAGGDFRSLVNLWASISQPRLLYT